MEHPGVDINHIKETMTIEEIQTKIQDLNRRLSFAYQTNNEPMLNQLTMINEVYMRAQFEVLQEMFGPDGDGPDLGDKIDIS